MNVKKLSRMSQEKVLHACNTHIKMRNKYRIEGNSHMAYMHGKRLMQCAVIARGGGKPIKGLLTDKYIFPEVGQKVAVV